MAQLTAYYSVLVFCVATMGCGGDSESILGSSSSVGGASSAGGVGGASPAGGGAGTIGGSTSQSEWLYASDDEGVFPQNRVLNIEVTMAADAWTNLISTATQEVWSTAYVTIDGQSVGTIGIRPKGAYSLDSCIEGGQLVCDKLSLKLKFNEVDSEGRFYGLKKLALNKTLDGGALFMESLAYRVFRDFGITAPRTSYATVAVNGEPLGIYTVVEVVDGRFTDRHFPDGNGNLYKEAWPDRTDNANFASALETNEDTATNEAFIAFATDMLAANDATLPQTLAKYMDVTSILDYMAVDYAIANWDGITTFYAGSWGQTNHNYYMYQHEKEARFTLIPWDLNATFFLDHWLGDIQRWDTLDADCDAWVLNEDSTDLYTVPASCDPMIRAIALSKPGYHDSVRRLLKELFVVESLSAKIDAYVAQLSEAIKSDPFVTSGEMTGGAAYIKGMLPVLRTRLEAVLTESAAL